MREELSARSLRSGMALAKVFSSPMILRQTGNARVVLSRNTVMIGFFRKRHDGLLYTCLKCQKCKDTYSNNTSMKRRGGELYCPA
jgi:hypothetical protein